MLNLTTSPVGTPEWGVTGRVSPGDAAVRMLPRPCCSAQGCSRLSSSPLGTQRPSRCPRGARQAGQAGERPLRQLPTRIQACLTLGELGLDRRVGGSGERKGEGRKEVGQGGGRSGAGKWRADRVVFPWWLPGVGSDPIPCRVPGEGVSGPQGSLYPPSTPTLTSLLSIPPQGPKGDVGVSGEQGVPGPPVIY